MSATDDLFEAISRENVEAMKAALKKGAKWRAPYGPGERDAAFTAATCETAAPLELLLDHGVPLLHEPKGRFDGTLLHRAAAFSRVDVIELLVRRGLAPDHRDALGRTPLTHARSSKHGKKAVPVLLALLSKRGATQQPAKKSHDLLPDAVNAAVAKLKLAAPTRKRLREVVKATFIEVAGATSKDFLERLAEQDDGELLAAGVQVVRAASTAAPKATKKKGGKNLRWVHHGDALIEGNCSAASLVVTGSLEVKGRLDNFEGAVGGDLKVDNAWSEGPLNVGGDLHAEKIFAGSYNDYATTVGGALITPVLFEDNHAIRARLEVGKHFKKREDVPTELLTVLGVKQ
ncbi:MAG: hypothetical protein ACO1OB_18115 [Archangium sp.]